MNWKAQPFYKISTAALYKNNIKDTDANCKANAFRAKPTIHYRRQYSPNTTSKSSLYPGRTSILNAPGSYSVQTINTPCIGLTYQPSNMLSSHDAITTCIIEPAKCNTTLSNKNKTFQSNRQLLYNRYKTFKQNQPSGETDYTTNYGFSQDTHLCSDGIHYVVKYHKPKNTKFFTNQAVTSSSQTLRQKYEVIKKDIKFGDFTKNSLAHAMAYNTPNKSKQYELFEKCPTKVSNRKKNKYCFEKLLL